MVLFKLKIYIIYYNYINSHFKGEISNIQLFKVKTAHFYTALLIWLLYVLNFGSDIIFDKSHRKFEWAFYNLIKQ